MALSDIALVTLAQAKNYLKKDAAASLQVNAEYIGMGDGETKVFTLDHAPIDGSLKLYVNGTLQTETTHFSISGTTITFVTAPTLNYPITASYDYSASGDTFESYDDELLEVLINAATKKVEDYCGRAFIQRSITEYHWGDGGTVLRLEKRPIVSITSVTIDDESLTVDTDYTERLSIGRLNRDAGWDENEQITVIYVAGYGETRAATQALVPDAVAAVLIAVAHWFENRLGLKSENVSGIGSVDYGKPGELPEAAKARLSSLKINMM